MIKTKEDLKRYLMSDNMGLSSEKNAKRIAYMKKKCETEYLIFRYLRYLRFFEYHLNKENTLFRKIMTLIYERKKNKLGTLLGLSIHPNCFGEGLTIFHHGAIIVNSGVRVGKNCKLHGSNCIGNNGVTEECPTIGDNVDIGFGAVVIGDITIADNIKIGANAVVNKSFTEPRITIAGVPAKRVK